jgi:ribosomal protein L37AE/L43A
MPDGKNLVIKPDEAELVRWVFTSYLAGRSTAWIAEGLNKKGVRPTSGASRWQHTSVMYLLSNEKYVGDSLCQKTFTESFPFRQKKNRGERDQYYVENTHPPIISHEMFDRAQELRKRKAQRDVNPKAQYPLTLKIVCAECGTPFVRREGKSGYVVWVCRKHNDKADACPNGRVPESELYAAFVRMYHKLKQNQDVILKPVLAQLDALDSAVHRCDPAMLAVNQEIAKAAEQSYKISQLQSQGLLDADACAGKLAVISARLTDLRAQRRRLLKNQDIDDAANQIRRTIRTVQSGPEQLDGFDEGLFDELVERIISESPTRVRFRLQGGIEFMENLREAHR